jgi:septal ring factor EnvC (AmiA/AmiB activator)
MIDENANTADLTIDEKLDRILQRLAALEAQGANTTRPLLNQLIKEVTDTREALTERMAAVEKELPSINHRLDAVAVNWTKTQGDIREHAERLGELESRPN